MSEETLFPIIDYISLVSYVRPEGFQLSNTINACRSLAHRVLGPRAVRCAHAQIPLTPEERSIVDESQGDCDMVRFEATLGESWDLAFLESAIRPVFHVRCRPRGSSRYSAYSICEDLWTLEFDAYPVSNGACVGSHLRMGFNLSRLREQQIGMLADVAREFGAAVVAGGGFGTGLCDVADVRETVLGDDYSSTGHLMVHFQRQLSRLLWVRSGESRYQKARGVFWGNYLGPQMMKTLGGEEFLREYESLKGLNENLCERYDDGSALVLLSLRASDMMFPNDSLMPCTIERGAWLYEQLGKAGLICGQ